MYTICFHAKAIIHCHQFDFKLIERKQLLKSQVIIRKRYNLKNEMVYAKTKLKDGDNLRKYFISFSLVNMLILI